MAEPFRDEMSAALTRAEKLAEENQDLREELKRLRETARSVRAEQPDHPLAAQTLAVLDRLEAATHVDALATAPTTAPPLVEHADDATLTKMDDMRWPIQPPDALVPHGDPKPVAPPPPLPPPRRSGVRVGTLLIACFVCLFVGIMLGAMTR